MYCMSFGQFPEWLFVITLTTFVSALWGEDFPFLILSFWKLIYVFIEL